MQENTT